MKQKTKNIIICILGVLIVTLLTTLLVKQIKGNQEPNENRRDYNINQEEKDIYKTKNKINIYFFRGEGCAHCAAEIDFLNSNKKIIDKYANVFIFETWENPKNEKLLYEMLDQIDEDYSGVPAVFIGKEYILGFGEDTAQNIMNLITEGKTKNYIDLYDKVKKERNEKK